MSEGKRRCGIWYFISVFVRNILPKSMYFLYILYEFEEIILFLRARTSPFLLPYHFGFFNAQNRDHFDHTAAREDNALISMQSIINSRPTHIDIAQLDFLAITNSRHPVAYLYTVNWLKRRLFIILWICCFRFGLRNFFHRQMDTLLK